MHSSSACHRPVGMSLGRVRFESYRLFEQRDGMIEVSYRVIAGYCLPTRAHCFVGLPVAHSWIPMGARKLGPIACAQKIVDIASPILLRRSCPGFELVLLQHLCEYRLAIT